MKAVIYLLAGALTVSFTNKETNAVDGIWTGIYRSDDIREKVLVRFEAGNHIELYNGEVVEANKLSGTYELQGDSLLRFTYHDAEGKSYVMQGTINKRKTFVDGNWEAGERLKGSFYLKKEKLEERFIAP
jgi:hypothetical protein